jgi:hypothetical protein
MSPPDSGVERSSSPPNPFGVKLRAVAKCAFMAEAEVKAKEIIAAKEKAEAEAAAEAAAEAEKATSDEVPSLLAAAAKADVWAEASNAEMVGAEAAAAAAEQAPAEAAATEATGAEAETAEKAARRLQRQQRRQQQQQRRQRLAKTAETAEEEKVSATAAPSPPSPPSPPLVAPPSPARLSATEAAVAAAEEAAAAAARLVGEEERKLAEAEERLREAAEAAAAMQAATVGAIVGDGGGGGGANDEVASGPAEARAAIAIDVAALQQRAAALQAELLEERELTRELLEALRQQSEREQLPMPHAAAVEAAAEAALRRAYSSGPMARGEAAAAEIEKLQRTLRTEREEHTRTKGAVGGLEAALATARLELEAAQRVVEKAERKAEEAAKAAEAGQEAAHRLASLERKAEEAARAAEAGQEAAHRLASLERKAEEAVRAAEEAREAQQRIASTALRDKEEAAAAFATEAETRRKASERYEKAEAQLAATQVELDALKLARERMLEGNQKVYDESAAGAAAAAAERQTLLSQLEAAHAERRALHEQLVALSSAAASARSLGQVMPQVTKLLDRIERAHEAGEAAGLGLLLGAGLTLADAAAAVGVSPAISEAADAAMGAAEASVAHAAETASGSATLRAMGAQVEEAARRAAEWEGYVNALRDQVANLEIELSGRPSCRAVKDLTVRVAELEAEIAEEKRRKREPLWPVQFVPRHKSPTREAIARDKAIARTGGGNADVDTMTPADRDALLIDVCRLLSLSSVHAVRDQVVKLAAVASKTPALETFVKAARKLIEDGITGPQRLRGDARSVGAIKLDASLDPKLRAKLEAQITGGHPDQATALHTPRWLLGQLRQWAAERTELAELRILRYALEAQLGKVLSQQQDGDDPSDDPAKQAAIAAAGGIEGLVRAREPSTARPIGPSRLGGKLIGTLGGGGSARRGGARSARRALGEAETELARLVAEAIGDGFAEATAAGGLSAGGVCAALREMVGASDSEGALRRVRRMCQAEKTIEAQTIQLALALDLPGDATLTTCLARVGARDATRKAAAELIDEPSARELLRRLRGHDGPSALARLDDLERKQAEYRNVFVKFQQEMRASMPPAVSAAAEAVWRGPGVATTTTPPPPPPPPPPMTSRPSVQDRLAARNSSSPSGVASSSRRPGPFQHNVWASGQAGGGLGRPIPPGSPSRV